MTSEPASGDGHGWRGVLLNVVALPLGLLLLVPLTLLIAAWFYLAAAVAALRSAWHAPWRRPQPPARQAPIAPPHRTQTPAAQQLPKG